MGQQQGGWRSRRSAYVNGWMGPRVASAPALSAAPPSAATFPAHAGASPASADTPYLGHGIGPAGIMEFLKRIDWSVSFIALIAYLASVVTFRLPIAGAAMTIGLIGLFTERNGLRLAPFQFFFWAFLAWASLSYNQSLLPADTFEALITLGKLSLIALVTTSVLWSLPRLHFVAYAYLFFYLIYPIRGTLINYFVIKHTLFGRAIWNYAFANPNDLAAFSFFPLALSIWLLQHTRHKLVRLGLFAMVGLLLLIILLTQSRGALIGLTIGLLMFFSGRSSSSRLRRLMVLAMAATLALPFVPSSAWERFGGMKALSSTETIADADEEGSAISRWEIWGVAKEIIIKNPVIGVGVKNYPPVHALQARQMEVPVGARGFRDTHSTYINVMAETGIPGFLLFMAMIISVLVRAEMARRASRDPEIRDLLYFLMTALICFMAAGIFGTFWMLNTLYLQLAVLGAVVFISTDKASGRLGRRNMPTATARARRI